MCVCVCVLIIILITIKYNQLLNLNFLYEPIYTFELTSDLIAPHLIDVMS